MAGSLRNDSDEMIFAHPDFVKDEPWGLESIKRKVSRPPPLSLPTELCPSSALNAICDPQCPAEPAAARLLVT